MREILFRGKRKDNGEWVYGDLIHYACNNGDIGIDNGFLVEDENDIETFDVIPETVGQYTGLTDKNGEKVFEGDILRFDYIGKNLGVNGISLCEFENGKFGVKWGYHKEFVCLDGFANTTLEVIGNIHDNKELLDDK